MRRDWELIRKILVEVEKQDNGETSRIIIEHDNEYELNRHIQMLSEAGLLDVIDASTYQGPCFFPRRLTFSGHDFLDSIRDDNIWKNTKTTLANVSGSASLEVIKQLASRLSMTALGL